MSEIHPVLETICLSRDFDGRFALSDVSLTVQQGEILALLGPNGVGKSTLLKLVSGLLMPTSGEARLWGRSSWPPSSEVRRVACVLDGMSPPRNSRVRDILDLRRCVKPEFDYGLARRLCEQHSIGLASRWHLLSKGQKHWVLLAEALSSRAELLLLDEPADGLDVATRRELYELLREMTNENGTSVVVASHIILDVERIADDVAILLGGKVRLHAQLEQLRDEACEVEFDRGADLSDIAPMAELISSRVTEAGSVAVVRFRSPHLVGQTLPGECARRRINLEDLYLAYTLPADVAEPTDTILA